MGALAPGFLQVPSVVTTSRYIPVRIEAVICHGHVPLPK